MTAHLQLWQRPVRRGERPRRLARRRVPFARDWDLWPLLLRAGRISDAAFWWLAAAQHEFSGRDAALAERAESDAAKAVDGRGRR